MVLYINLSLLIMDTKQVKPINVEVSEAELHALMKMRNKRTESYNLRVSEKELAYLVELQGEVEAQGTKFDGRIDFVLHCAKTVATITKSQLKLM